MQRALDQTRARLLGGRDRQQRRDLLAPQIQPLIQRAAARAGREMQLRLARLARAREPEREPRDERLARLAAVTGEPHQLVAADGQIRSSARLTLRGVIPRCSAISGRRRPWLCSATISRWRSESRSSTACVRRSTSAWSSRSISSSSGARAAPATG